MIDAYAVAQIRGAETPALAAGKPLMQQAAHALADVVRGHLKGSGIALIDARVVGLVGPGGNGGDTLYALAELGRAGVRVQAILAAPNPHAEGLRAFWEARGEPLRLLTDDAVPAQLAAGAADADVLLDGLLGIGAHGGLREPAAGLVEMLRDRPRRATVIAVDTPSGIGVDDGTVPGVVLPADLTVTFGGVKAGLLVPPARWLSGRVIEVDMDYDLPPARIHEIEDADVPGLWAVPGPTDHKYTRGVVGLVTGSERYPGAAVLGASAAVHAGAGMVRYLGPGAVLAAVLARRPEVVGAPGRVQSWVVGSGLEAGGGGDRLPAALASGLPCVVDAGALTELPERVGAQVVLTPHAGELTELLKARGEGVDRTSVEAAPLHWARRAHELTGATVLLKGSTTLVVGPAGVWTASAAPAWLATAGAGDVLAGLLGAVLAGHSERVCDDPSAAAVYAALAAHVHGRAADMANPGGPVAALDVADAIGPAVAALLDPDASGGSGAAQLRR